MAFDGVYMRALCAEFNRLLIGARINKIQQPEKEELLITLKTLRDGSVRLLISANPSLPFIYITEENKISPLTAPNFCMLLRKHISNGRILKISQPGLERILDIEIEHQDEMGDLKVKHLITEIMGKYSNIIFTDENYMILDSIRHVPPTLSSVRTVLPGREWFIVTTQGKKDLFTETKEGFFQDLKPTDTCLSAFTDHYTGLSRPTVSEFLFSKGVDPDTFISSLQDNEKDRFYRLLEDFRDLLLKEDFSLEAAYEDRTPTAFSAFPLDSYRAKKDPVEIRTFTSPSELLFTYYRDRNIATNMKQRSQDMRKSAETLLSRAVKKLDLQNRQLKDAEKRDTYRLYGEMLTAYAYSLPEGEKNVTVINYLDDNRELTIPVDPDLSIRDNAKRYYDRYGKMKRTFEALTNQVAETQEEIEHLSSIIQAIDMAEENDVLKQIREEMTDAGYLKKAPSGNKKRERSQSRPYHYVSSDGFDIYIGKNNLQNEYLTFRLADNKDIWMHAKKMPGSHVIIRTEGKEVPDRTYEEAASLALYYSAGRDQDKGEVDYIEKKQIRKPNGARPGFVVYYTNYSMMAEPGIPDIKREDS